MVVYFLPFLNPYCFHSLFLVGSVETLGMVTFTSADVGEFVFGRGVKRGVEVLFRVGVKRGVRALVVCWDC